jgi:predicted alpha/beta-hydrolase family hydrolase
VPDRLETELGPIGVLTDGPIDAPTTVVLAPGAGADMHHAFMSTVAEGLGARGYRVVRFNFVYAEAGRKAPDRQPVLEATYRAVLDHLGSTNRLVIGGKSMGGRIASHLAASGVEADGVLFLGYPLHPPGKPERIRDEHLRDIRIPMLFIEGTRDPFCPLDTLERVRKGLTAPTDVVAIDDGDHSFKVRKSSGRSTEDAWNEVVDAAAGWLERL